MPNNESNYNYQLHRQQKDNFEQNTLIIVKNIEQACGQKHSEKPIGLTEDLHKKFTSIVNRIAVIKQNQGSNVLLQVPGYSAQDMRNQVEWGFNAILPIIGSQDLANETLDSFADKFLKSPDALLDGRVVHLFYDRAHIEAALEQDKKIAIGGKEHTFKDLLECMVKKLQDHPENYPQEAREQFTIRLNLVAMDLANRAALKPFVKPAESLPPEKTSTPTSSDTSDKKKSPIETTSLETDENDLIRIKEILDNFQSKIKKLDSNNSDSDAIAEVNRLHIELIKLKDTYAQAKSRDPDKARNDFVIGCKAEIEKSIPTLDKKLGWGSFLLNMLKQLVNAVCRIPAQLAGFDGTLFKLKHTDEGQAAADLQEDIQNTKPTP
ncbi:hypothetical protein [Legionella sp. W05-934-2]|jgi:hypothetical protein|uniref:hypothetical protein n=1 Tax=Legionella sp. W05-934-2 TaxID=1198649 RepID=UPI003461BE67